MEARTFSFMSGKTLPVFIASEAAECGLACLAMVGSYHGHDINLNGLRQRFSFSLSGATLRTLIQVADQLGLAARPLKVELLALRHLAVPAILHWSLDHFVVLRAATKDGLIIHDPAKGKRTVTWAEASNLFTGVALELKPAATFEPIESRPTVRVSDLWSKVTGVGSTVVQVVALSAALQIIAFAAPFQLQLIIDEVLLRGDQDLLIVLSVGFAGLIVLHAVVELLRGWVVQVLTQVAGYQVTGNIVRHLLRLRADFFEKRHVGDLISRVGSARAIQDVLSQGAVSVALDGVMAIAAGFILFVYSPTMAAVVLVSVLLNLTVSQLAYASLRSRNQEQLEASAKEQSHLMESVRAATIIKLLGGEAERESSWRNLYARVVNASLSAWKWRLSVQSIQTTVVGLQTVVVLYLAARMILNADGFSVGMLVAFLAFRQIFTDRTTSLINQISQFRLLGLHLERLSDIVTAETELPEFAAAEEVSAAGHMRLHNVSFRYGVNDRLVLADVDLEVQSGEFLAITGRSGGGKTTLLKLMLGIHRPSGGTIRLEDREATPALWRAWRDQVGVVSQDDRLLSGTLAENISFFDTDLDMSRVVEAAKAALIHDEILQMPMQYRSYVGDMGAALSGGQKQRVLLARALYRKPKVLFLDEGTANLDVKTEEQIADALEGMAITRVVVAHRPALLERAHRIVIVEDGRVIAAKRHEAARLHV